MKGRVVIPLLFVVLSGCGPSLPDSYGIYANTDRGRLRLEGQRIAVTGNLFRQIPGLKGPSGVECGSLKSFTVYWKDVVPDRIQLSRLEVEKDALVPEILGASRVAVNLWVPKVRVEIDIQPVERHPDMYIIVPREPLTKGFYALHIGAFGSEIPLMGGQVYDIVVGAAKDFPSYEAVIRDREQSIRSTAADLLSRMNQMFNSRDYAQLGEVYRASGQILTGVELEEYIKGTHTWFDTAGKVVRSQITQVTVSEDGSTAHCSVKTIYEKAGEQTESVELMKIGDRFFISAMN
jgi:hypothetical protein